MKPILCGIVSVAAVLGTASSGLAQAVVWEGRTSQDKQLSFTIANGAVTKVSLDWVLPLGRMCATPGSPVGITQTGGQNNMFFYANSPGNESPQVTAGAFRLTRELSGPPARVKMVLTGRLSSGNEASGTLALSSEDCQGSATLTWTAKRQGAAAAAPTGLGVASVKRTKEYESGGGSVRPTNEEDVVLVLTLAGISVDDFRKADRDTIYVMAGERQCRPSMATSGIVNGKPIVQLAVVVPRSVLAMRLFVGAYPPVPFKAPVAVTESDR